MNTNLNKKSLKKIQKNYQSVKSPNWLLQDTIQKTEQLQDCNGFKWAAPITAGLAALVFVVIILPQKTIETDTTFKSPSFADLDISSVKPKKLSLPNVTITSIFKGHVPTMPKSPMLLKQNKQSSLNVKQHSLPLTELYFYKETNKYV